MEIDDYRKPGYTLAGLIQDYILSREFQQYLDKQSYEYDVLTGTITMEKYLLVKSKCHQCLTKRDLWLIYYIEKATYSNYKEFITLPPSHQNCGQIDETLVQQERPRLSFSMLLTVDSVYGSFNFQQLYNLFRYYKIIVSSNDSISIDYYLEEYERISSIKAFSMEVSPALVTPPGSANSGSELPVLTVQHSTAVDTFIKSVPQIYGTQCLDVSIQAEIDRRKMNLSILMNANPAEDESEASADEEVVKISCGVPRGQDEKKSDVGVWPKWPNIV